MSKLAFFALQADQSNNLLRRVNLANGLVTTLAGNVALSSGPPNNYGFSDGFGTAASFWNPTGVAVDGAGTFAVVVRSGAKRQLLSVMNAGDKGGLACAHNVVRAMLFFAILLAIIAGGCV